MSSLNSEQPQLCPDCVTGEKLEGTPKGAWIEDEKAPLKAYYASATSNTTTSNPHQVKTKKVLVLAMDLFGFEIPNPKLLADLLAEKAGVDVWVPDIFKGQILVPEQDLVPYMPDHGGHELGFMKNAMRYLVLAKNMPTMIQFRPGVQDPWIVNFVDYLRKEYGYESVGMIGYCWGGGTVVRLAAKPGVLDTALAVHPSGQYTGEMANATCPIAYFIPETDHAWDPKAAAATQAKWASRSDAPKHQFIHYPGAAHGFGSRPALQYPKVKEAWIKLINDNVAWLNETL